MTFFDIFIALIAGAVTGWLMHLLMLASSRRQEVPVDMVKALGSYWTKDTTPRASQVGLILHTLGGALLGLVYSWLLHLIAIDSHPVAILAGFILGHFHGLIVSFSLMYWVADRHPVEAYRNATMQVGIIHLLGHIFFGTAVGLVIYLSNL